MKTATRETYAKRIERVAEYLFDHLDDDLDLHRLAEEAFLSPYHFHRVYRSMTGETVTETVRRLRLHRAAVSLTSSRVAIETITREAGYATVPAFTRAFRAAYAMPPAAYREKQFRHESGAHLREHLIARSHNLEQELAMKNITIEQRHPIRVAALAHRGDYQQIGNAFERLNAWASGHGIDVHTTRSFGIYYDDPAAVACENLHSDACIEITDGFTPTGEYTLKHTPGGRCAVLIHKGPYADLEQAYQWLFGVWLAQSGEEPAEAPSFEEYLNDPRLVPASELLTAICLPLKD